MKAALNTYLKTGNPEGLEQDDESHVMLPEDAEAKIMARLTEASPMRQIASIRYARGSVTHVEQPRLVDGKLNATTFSFGELYAMPAGTVGLLDELEDAGTWLADEVRDVFAAQETTHFVNGDGINKPRGFMMDLDKMRSVVAPHISVDALLSLIYSIPAQDRSQGSFVMNRRTLSNVRKIKYGDGNYLWQPSLGKGFPSTLLGYPIVEMEDMEDEGAEKRPVAFGNFKRGYEIVDKQGVRVLRDPYSAKPYVLFYTTKSVGGGVKFGDAIATLKTLY